MNEIQHRKAQIRAQYIEIVVKFLSVILGVWVGVYQFNKQQYALKETELTKSIWEDRIRVYKQVTLVVGDIASSASTSRRDSVQFTAGVTKFNQLFWGELSFLDDSAVTAEAMNYRIELADYNTSTADAESYARLTDAGDSLVLKCRRSSDLLLARLRSE